MLKKEELERHTEIVFHTERLSLALFWMPLNAWLALKFSRYCKIFLTAKCCCDRTDKGMYCKTWRTGNNTGTNVGAFVFKEWVGRRHCENHHWSGYFWSDVRTYFCVSVCIRLSGERWRDASGARHVNASCAGEGLLIHKGACIAVENSASR